MVTHPRLDIARVVRVAIRTSEPTEPHWTSLKKFLPYLKGTIQMGVLFEKHEKAALLGYSDADYANSRNRRSTTGYVIYWGNNVLTWTKRPSNQPHLTLSTTEAEHIARAELVKKLILLKTMMQEPKLIEDRPVQIYIDNKSTVNTIRQKFRVHFATAHSLKRDTPSSRPSATGLAYHPLFCGTTFPSFVSARARSVLETFDG